ncbi:MAG: hypothetical protein LBN05_01185 [Oscillospiraceae bacterium]|jgi:hypothetical protein|nr:hypothetical protein [Oscillospiraceae bacterium]
MKELLNSNRYRYLHGKQFFPAVISAVVTAFASLTITKLITKYALMLPTDSFEPLYSNGYYNFGVLKVQHVQDLANLSVEQLMSSAFIGGFLAMILAIFIPMFICGSFKGGYIQNAYVRGNSKLKILLSYVVSSLEIFFTVYVAYIVSLLLFSSVMNGTTIGGTELLNCLAVFGRELFAHFVFLAVCIAASFMVNKTSACVISLIFSVIAFPGLLTTADLIFQSDFKLSSLWIVNIIGLWSVTPLTNFATSFIVALITLFISIGTALIMFVYSDIKQ